MIQKLFDFFSGNDSGKCYGFFEFDFDFVKWIFSDDLGFFQIIIEGFYGGDFSFYGFGLVLLVQMGDVVFNLPPLWGVGIGVCEILPEISLVGFEGVVVEFFAVFAEFQGILKRSLGPFPEMQELVP